MSMRIVYDYNAVLDLKLLPRNIADRITLKIAWYASRENPMRFAKPLQKPFESLYRFRIGNYRAIFEANNEHIIRLLIILRVKHRKDAYD